MISVAYPKAGIGAGLILALCFAWAKRMDRVRSSPRSFLMFLRHYLTSSLVFVALGLSSQTVSAAPRIAERPANAPAQRLLSVTPPACSDASCWTDGNAPEPQVVGLRTVYLNFEGVTLLASNTQPDDATSNKTWIISSVAAPGSSLTIPPFNPNELSAFNGFTTRQEIINYTVDKLRAYHTPYNIKFTTTRPTSGTYHMVIFGGSCEGVIGQSGCAGIAPLDCSDFSPSNIVFAFPPGLRAVDLATTAAQEMAHAFGLSHTLDVNDLMYPQIQNSLPAHYGAGPIPAQDQGPCGNGTYQDSHELLLSIVGFPGQDGTPPSVLITEPANGQAVQVGANITANISDNSGSITKVELLLNNEIKGTKTTPPFDFSLPATSPSGQVFIDVRATDASGNTAGNRITVYVGSGDEEACQNGVCPEGFTCTEMLCYADELASSGALGEVCGASEDCDSSICAEVKDEQRCSQTCNAENACPEGFKCLDDTACWPRSPGTSGSCSSSGSSPGVLMSLAFVLLAAIVGRRRRTRA